MLQSLDRCIRANPANYFITVPFNALPLLLEKLYAFDEKSEVSLTFSHFHSHISQCVCIFIATTQIIILDLLTYVMLDLNYVPFKELAVISLHLQSNQSKSWYV